MSEFRTDSLFAKMDVDSRFRGNDKEVVSCNHIIRVAFESGVDTEFDYLLPDKLWPIKPGQRVEVPFGRKNKIEKGFCVEIVTEAQRHRGTEAQRSKGFKLKKVLKVIDKEPLVNENLMKLARWIGSYYVCPLGQVLTAMVPAAVKKGAGVKTQRYVYLSINKADYEKQIKELRGKKQKQVITFLQDRRAVNSKSALELQSLLAEVGCTNAPVKKLAEKQIIKIAQKTILKSLPVIPAGMAIKAEKVILNQDQQKALAHINAEINSGEFSVTLLYGVTDSGKTELYIRAIEAVLQKAEAP